MDFTYKGLAEALEAADIRITIMNAVRDDTGEIIDFSVKYMNGASTVQSGKPVSERTSIVKEYNASDEGRFFRLLKSVMVTGIAAKKRVRFSLSHMQGINDLIFITVAKLDECSVVVIWQDESSGAEDPHESFSHLWAQTENSEKPAFILNENLDPIFFNKAWISFRGTSHEAECAKKAYDIVHQSDLSGFYEKLEDCKRTKEPNFIEFRLLNFEGEYKWQNALVFPIFSSTSRFVAAIAYCFDFTEKKLYEESIHKIEAIFSVPDAGIIIKDITGKLVDWNIGAENILGYTKEEVLGQTNYYYSNKDSHNELNEINKRVASGEHISHIELQRIHKDGRIIDCSSSFTPIRDSEGKVTGSIVIFHDITDKIASEQKALSLSAILTIEDAGIILRDENGVIRHWNVGAENLLGYTADEVIGNTTKKFATDESFANYEYYHQKVLAGEHIPNTEVLRYHKDGRIVNCSVSYTPIINSQGKVTGSVAVFHDISEKKRMEQLHRQAEKELHSAYQDTAAVFNTISAPICAVSRKDGTVLGLNSAFAGMLFANEGEILNSSINNCFIQSEGVYDEEYIINKLRQGAPFNCSCRRRDGTFIDVEVVCRSFVYKEQEAFAVHCMDLTKQQAQERILKDAAFEAMEASRMKSTFLANMSHEIRTPMNGVIGFTELALDEDDITDTVRSYLEKIRISAIGLLDIINDVLDISKIEAGKMTLEAIPFSLHNIFKICDAINTPKAEEKGISLYFYAEPLVNKKLMGDPTRLRQVFLNLLSNAIKFTNEGMVKMLSVVEELTEDKATIYFEVKDTGIGMEQQRISKIFDPFNQADSSTTRKYGGTGLGLTISKNIIELMGGTLNIESVVGIGSKFSFTLTLDLVDDETEAIFNKKTASSRFNRKPTFEGHVLVCEDNEINKHVAEKHLNKLGLKVTIASNGKEAVEITRSHMEKGGYFDVILMDIHMPVMDGIEATKLLREMGCLTPIVAMTANVISTDKEIYFNNGMSDYIGKPFMAQELWACLMKYMTPTSITDIEANEDVEDNVRLIIDKRLGLERAVGDGEFYKKLLTNFYHSNQTVCEEIKNAINNKDFASAHRTAHTLKGVAALIGALPLSNCAYDVERALSRDNPRVTSMQISALSDSLNAVFTAISPMLEPEKPKLGTNTQALDKTRAMDIIEKIEPLLDRGNSKCMEYIDEIIEALSPLGSKCDMLIEFMEDYDFEKAHLSACAIKDLLEEHDERQS